ncbi:hypothetical protein ES702_03196 [subsurface metagenome]
MKERILDAMKRATIFLLKDYLDRARPKRDSLLSTRALFGEKNGLRDVFNGMRAELSAGIEEAEDLLSELQS